jgi:Caspase domain
MLRLVAVLISGVLSVPELAEQRVALVIGNDSYSNVPVLQKAAADARTMTASLSKLGFDVETGVNVSRTETNRSLQDFLNHSAGAGEAALDRLGDADPEPNSVFTRTFVPLLAQGGLNLPELAPETRRRVHELAASASQSQTPAYYDEVLGDFSFGEGSGPRRPLPPHPSQCPRPYPRSR